LRAHLCLFLALSVLPLGGCAIFGDAPHYRGNEVSAHDLRELTVGLSTQTDAQAVLGPPTFTEQFAPNDWVYAAQVTKMRIGNTEGIKQQQVVVLTFNDAGTLTGIDKRGLNDRVDVAMDDARTPVPGGHAGLIQQLIGGVGSYNPGIGGNTGAGGLGAGASGLGGASGDIGGTSSGGGL
jgi:outer membrane protein assembly factor BamE (lipoprotein component of BamABCDE complex)